MIIFKHADVFQPFLTEWQEERYAHLKGDDGVVRISEDEDDVPPNKELPKRKTIGPKPRYMLVALCRQVAGETLASSEPSTDTCRDAWGLVPRVDDLGSILGSRDLVLLADRGRLGRRSVSGTCIIGYLY